MTDERPSGGASRPARLTCYRMGPLGPRIVPGRAERAWMDATDVRFAYRCLPLTIANAMGWEILTPARVTAEWNGGAGLADLTVEVEDEAWGNQRLASSHFGHGIVTFQTGYLFRTDPGVALWVRGAPNRPKDGIAPLDGVVETDWLPFTFTMNWQFTRPGRVSFEADEPFCFVMPLDHHALDQVEPEIVPLENEPELAAQYQAWRDARNDFNARLARDDPETVRQGWQKWYLRGETATGAGSGPGHIGKLRLATPRIRDAAGAAPQSEPAPDEPAPPVEIDGG